MQLITKVFIAFIVFFILWALYVENEITNNSQNVVGFEEILKNAEKLERLLQLEKEHMHKLEENIMKIRKNDAHKNVVHSKHWKEPIPVLVFSCNRAVAVGEHVKKLMRYRPSKELFPIIVTQDCDNVAVRTMVASFRGDVDYIKHVSGENANISIPRSHRQYTAYYRIARHYKLALDYVFKEKGYTSVIITEDDLDISPDFFSYFSSTRYLLESDSELWCVSAWNDNGKPENIDISANSKLYRTDFFPGLGWMLTSQLWNELAPIWPSGFWDDWMRDPSIRKNRQCIRPEISRTGMTTFGREGASKGQFFNKHLIKIRINENPVDFSKENLDYLLPQEYAKMYKKEVMEESKLLDIQNVPQFLLNNTHRGSSIRIMYDGNIDYIEKADKLHIMHDFKAGVPRTAYDGIVTCFINGIRVFLVPDRQKVKGYDPTWEVPPAFGE